MEPIITLVHGVATTSSVWSRVAPLLSDFELRIPDRACSGDLARELNDLAPLVRDTFVVGASGGATLALALAASDVSIAGAVAHEPAVGSLVPGLLGSVASAHRERGLEGFGSALYGSGWSIKQAGADVAAVDRELPMFHAFEPASARAGQGPILVTVGGESPPPRQTAARELRQRLGYRVESIPGANHFVQWDDPVAFAAVIRRFVASATALVSDES